MGVLRNALVVLCTLALARDARAQIVHGRVMDAELRTPVAGAEVVLRAAGAADIEVNDVADDSGSFRMVVPRAGDYTLEAMHVGHTQMAPVAVRVGAGEAVEVVVRLARGVIPLEPLTVVARRSNVAQDATFEGALARHAAFPALGNRRVLLRSDPEYNAARSLGDILNWLPQPRSCLFYFWNGRLSQLGDPRDVMLESANNFEAVEFYRSYVDAPLGMREQLVGAANVSCSLIAVWPRQFASAAERPHSLLRLVAGLAALVLVVVLLK